MKTHEVADFVRENSETLRAYPWREVERMREDLASVSMLASLYQAKIVKLGLLADKVEAAQQRARSVKDYETADALREIIAELRGHF